MKLHELVELKNRIKSFTESETLFDTSELQQLITLFNLTGQLNFQNNKETIYPVFTKLIENFDNLKKELNKFIDLIDKRISEITKDWHKMGYLTNAGAACAQLNPDEERNLRSSIVPYEVKGIIHGLVSKYTNDAYPVLEIGPGDGDWTDFLVAGDPLYLIDRHREFLDRTVSKYPEQYQRRIRTYKIAHGDLPDSDMSMLPENQFNFIFSWNVFNYFPLDYTTAFLMGSMKLLRPGGIMVFSYNNCEDAQCAKYAEIGHCSWMPKTMLKNKILELGFEINNLASQSGWHWVEIRKPGDLKTVKIHQSLGEIVHRPR